MINNQNYLSQPPKGWMWTKLGEVLGFVKGKKPANLGARDKVLTIPYINIKAFEKKVFDQYTNGEGCSLCTSKDILIVWDGARCGLVGRGIAGAIGSTLAKLVYHNINQLYLFYFLQTRYEYINKRPRGVGIPHVEPNLFWDIDFPIPSLPEQQRIVAKIEELFTKLDAGVAALKKVKAELKRYRQSVLANALSGQLTKQKDNWKTLGFFDFCVLQRGYDLPLAQKKDGKYPIVTSAGIAAYHSEYKATKPGVIVGRSGSIGKAHYIEEDYWPHNTTLYVKDFKGNFPKFVYYYLLNFNFIRHSASTAVPTLNRNNLRKVFVNVPPLNEQHQIVSEIERRFSVADKVEKAIEQGLKQAERLRQSILKRAFEGKLVPQDPSDEPAEKLLERIKQERILLPQRY